MKEGKNGGDVRDKEDLGHSSTREGFPGYVSPDEESGGNGARDGNNGNGEHFSGEERRSNERRSSHRRGYDAEYREQIESLKEELTKKGEEILVLKDTMLRRQADFENYKKRAIKQQEEQRRYSIRNIAHDIIQINDDLLRAIEASSNVTEGSSLEDAHRVFIEGVSMISRRIEETLEKFGVVEIESQGMEFDPRYHEAVEFEIASDVSVDTVSKVYLKGFRIDDLVVRTARVKVTKPMPAAVDSGDTGSGE